MLWYLLSSQAHALLHIVFSFAGDRCERAFDANFSSLGCAACALCRSQLLCQILFWRHASKTRLLHTLCTDWFDPAVLGRHLSELFVQLCKFCLVFFVHRLFFWRCIFAGLFQFATFGLELRQQVVVLLTKLHGIRSCLLAGFFSGFGRLFLRGSLCVFLGLLFALLSKFFLLLGHDFATGTTALRQTASRADGGKQTDLIGCLAVFFQSVCAGQGQARLRTLEHLLCNLCGNLGGCTNSQTFTQCGQQLLVCQLCDLLCGFTQEGFLRDASQFTDKAAAQRNERTCHIQGSLRNGSSGGRTATNVNLFTTCNLLLGLALNVATKLLYQRWYGCAQTATDQRTIRAEGRTSGCTGTSASKGCGNVGGLLCKSGGDLTQRFFGGRNNAIFLISLLDFV